MNIVTKKLYGAIMNISILGLMFLGGVVQLYVDAFKITTGWGKFVLIVLAIALLLRLLVYIFGVIFNGNCSFIALIVGVCWLAIMLCISIVIREVMFGSLLMILSTGLIFFSDIFLLVIFYKEESDISPKEYYKGDL